MDGSAPPIKAWSHSALDQFETCPKRYYHLNVAKDFQETKSEAQDWGTEVHLAMQKRFQKGTPFPLGMKQFEPLVAPLLTLPGKPVVEQKLALDIDLQACGWFDKHVWVRVVVDAAFIRSPRALLIDWKTGKRKDDDDQLALMAGVMFAQMPELEVVDASFCWLQERADSAFARSTFKRADVPAIWERFLARVDAFQTAFRHDSFPAVPSGLCRRYCPVKSCPYHGAS